MMFKEVILIFVISIMCVNAGEYLDINISYDHGKYNYEILGLNYYESFENLGSYVYQSFDVNNDSLEVDTFDFDREIRFYYEDGTDEVFLMDYYSKVLSFRYYNNLERLEIYDDNLNRILDIDLIEEVSSIEQPEVEAVETVRERDYLLYFLIFILFLIIVLFIYLFRRLGKKVFFFIILFCYLVSGIEELVDISNNFNGIESESITYSGDLSVIKSGSNRIVKFEEGSVLNVKGQSFEGIVPYSKKTSSSLTLDSKGEIIKADFLVGNSGGNYNINGVSFYAPPGSTVKFDKGVVTMNVLSGSELKELPLSKNGPDMRIKGENIKLDEDHTLSKGEISVKKDGFYVKDAVINEAHVYSENEIKLFLDGDSHGVDNSYVSLGKNKVFTNIAMGKGDFHLDFSQNSFFKGDVSFDFNDKETYSLKMEDLDPIPLVSLNSKMGGNVELFTLKNGPNKFIVNSDQKVMLNVGHDKSKGANFGLDMKTAYGIGSIYFDGNGLSQMPYIDTKPRIFVNEVTKELFQKKYGIGLEGDYSDEDLALLSEKLDLSTLEMRRNVKGIVVYDDMDSLKEACKSKIALIGCAGDEKIFLLRRMIGTNTLDHEFGHLLHGYHQEKAKEFELIKTLNPLLWFSEKEYPNLEDEWRSVAFGGTKYGYLGDAKLKDASSFVPISMTGTPYLPAKGFCRDYGTKSWEEDISTMLECVKGSSDRNFNDYVCKSGKNYDLRYAKKVDLLYKFKFISSTDYNRVFAGC